MANGSAPAPTKLHPYFEPDVLAAVGALADQQQQEQLEAAAREILHEGRSAVVVVHIEHEQESGDEDDAEPDRVTLNAAGVVSMLQLIRDEQIALREQVERLANILGER